MYDYLHCHLNYKRNRRISSLSTCFEDLSHMPFMIITVHISLGHFECHWKYFNRQLDKTHQLQLSLTHQPAAPSHLLSPLQVELTTISDMYNSCKSTIISAINLLNTDPSFDGHTQSNTHLKEAYYPS